MFNPLAREFIFYTLVCPCCVKEQTDRQKICLNQAVCLQFACYILMKAQLCALNCHKKYVVTGDMYGISNN